MPKEILISFGEPYDPLVRQIVKVENKRVQENPEFSPPRFMQNVKTLRNAVRENGDLYVNYHGLYVSAFWLNDPGKEGPLIVVIGNNQFEVMDKALKRWGNPRFLPTVQMDPSIFRKRQMGAPIRRRPVIPTPGVD